MQFETIDALLHMGGHGFYVWLAYGLTFLLMGLMVLFPVLKRRQQLRIIRQISTIEQEDLNRAQES